MTAPGTGGPAEDAQMRRRWDVQVRPDVFEDVGATYLHIDAGTLVFRDAADRVLIAYATGQWLTVTPQEGTDV